MHCDLKYARGLAWLLLPLGTMACGLFCTVEGSPKTHAIRHNAAITPSAENVVASVPDQRTWELQLEKLTRDCEVAKQTGNPLVYKAPCDSRDQFIAQSLSFGRQIGNWTGGLASIAIIDPNEKNQLDSYFGLGKWVLPSGETTPLVVCSVNCDKMVFVLANFDLRLTGGRDGRLVVHIDQIDASAITQLRTLSQGDIVRFSGILRPSPDLLTDDHWVARARVENAAIDDATNNLGQRIAEVRRELAYVDTLLDLAAFWQRRLPDSGVMWDQWLSESQAPKAKDSYRNGQANAAASTVHASFYFSEPTKDDLAGIQGACDELEVFLEKRRRISRDDELARRFESAVAKVPAMAQSALKAVRSYRELYEVVPASNRPRIQWDPSTSQFDHTFFPYEPSGLSLDGEAELKSDQTKVTCSDGLVVENRVLGHGATALYGAIVSVRIQKSCMGANRLDPSRDAFTFRLGARQVSPALDEGIYGMRVGGKRAITIPHDLSDRYEAQACAHDVPFVCEVELIDVH
jgi:hypothetical protein